MTLDALVVEEPDRVHLRLPAVGAARLLVGPGQLLVAGQVFGTVDIVGARHELVVPAGFGGRVVEAAHGVVQGGYGTPLLVLDPAGGGAAADFAHAAVVDPAGEVIRAPMDGQFYRRSAPGEPDFAPPGSRVAPGQTIGLIEVMKFFYPIRYEGTGDRWCVEYRAKDAAPINGGAALIVLSDKAP